jgi:SAM-dependent MidA family methyltransferase
LEFVLSPGSTIASRTILQHRLNALRRPEKLTALEVCAEGVALVESIALRIRKSGGFALFVDYGQDAPYGSSLNAIKDHQPVHALEVSTSLLLPSGCGLKL